MKHGSARNLEVVLRLMEEAGADIVAFQTEGEVWIPPVIRSASCHDRIRIAATESSLWLFVGSSKKPV